MDVLICSFKPHSKGGILCLPKSEGHKNIWLPEESLQEFTSARYGEVSIIYDGVDSNGYFINPRPTQAVGLTELVDTTSVEEYFRARKKAKVKLTIPKSVWGDLKESEEEAETEVEEEEEEEAAPIKAPNSRSQTKAPNSRNQRKTKK